MYLTLYNPILYEHNHVYTKTQIKATKIRLNLYFFVCNFYFGCAGWDNTSQWDVAYFVLFAIVSNKLFSVWTDHAGTQITHIPTQLPQNIHQFIL